jgi:C-terminal processing protease CtpA/Prc
MSVGEFMSMIFKRAPNALMMGSNTAGADGAVTVIGLPGNISVNFTWFGMYWPDGSETQKVGLKPDIVFYPTIKGYQQKKDELLDNAIQYLSEKK